MKLKSVLIFDYRTMCKVYDVLAVRIGFAIFLYPIKFRTTVLAYIVPYDKIILIAKEKKSKLRANQ